MSKDTLVGLEDEKVRAILDCEEARGQNCAFVGHDALVDEILMIFQTKPLLEAVLVTHNGKETEKLLGIATRWDVFKRMPGV